MKRLRIALILGILLILAYWAIPSDHATMRLRVIVTAEVDGEKVEGSSVMELTDTRIGQSLMGMGGSTTLKAEALVLDLKNRGAVFLLPCKVNVDGTLSEVYEHDAMGSFGVVEPVGGMTAEGLAKLRKAKGRVPFRYYDTYWKRSNPPLFVAFKNEADPRSIYRVDEKRLDLAFGPGVRLLGIELETTDAPLTHVLAKRLPWLDQGNHQLGAASAWRPNFPQRTADRVGYRARKILRQRELVKWQTIRHDRMWCSHSFRSTPIRAGRPHRVGCERAGLLG